MRKSSSKVRDFDVKKMVKILSHSFGGLAEECVSDHGKAICSEIGGECITEQDGYYYVSLLCVTFGTLLLVFYVAPTARRLQCASLAFCTLNIGSALTPSTALPVNKWRVNLN